MYPLIVSVSRCPVAPCGRVKVSSDVEQHLVPDDGLSVLDVVDSRAQTREKQRVDCNIVVFQQTSREQREGRIADGEDQIQTGTGLIAKLGFQFG